MAYRFRCHHGLREQGYDDFRKQILKLAGGKKRFPPSRLPPTWVEADRLVKLRRKQEHHIVSVRDLVTDLRDGSGKGSSKEKPHPASSITGAGDTQSEEDWRNAVVSTVSNNDTYALGRGGGGGSRKCRQRWGRAIYRGGVMGRRHDGGATFAEIVYLETTRLV